MYYSLHNIDITKYPHFTRKLADAKYPELVVGINKYSTAEVISFLGD